MFTRQRIHAADGLLPRGVGGDRIGSGRRAPPRDDTDARLRRRSLHGCLAPLRPRVLLQPCVWGHQQSDGLRCGSFGRLRATRDCGTDASGIGCVPTPWARAAHARKSPLSEGSHPAVSPRKLPLSRKKQNSDDGPLVCFCPLLTPSMSHRGIVNKTHPSLSACGHQSSVPSCFFFQTPMFSVSPSRFSHCHCQ